MTRTAQTMTLRVLTLNTWKCDGDYRHRLDLMAQGLAHLSPDLVLLQEAFASLEGQADTAAHLAKALSMQVTCAPARLKLRGFEGRPCHSSSGLALLSREPVLAHHVLPLPTDPADGERIAQIVQVQHAGRTLWIAQLHLTHLPQASDLRAAQLDHALQALRQHSDQGPALIGGDFNSGPGRPEFDRLLAPPWDLRNPFEGRIKTTHRSEDGGDLDLDHLLLSGWPMNAVRGAAVTLDPRTAAAGQGVSDHAAVMLDLDLHLPSH
jgi:endonuclease/exonuclease/phosphatase family metal-dependent hydrolase